MGRFKISLVYFFSALVLSGIFTVCFFARQWQESFDESFYPNIVRMQIVGESSGEEDQALKLALKERVVAYTAAKTRFCKSAEQAERILCASLPEISDFAVAQAKKLGYAGKVETTFGEQKYTVRPLGNFTFPAGNYRTLRIRLGEARGKNWWGVLYPNLCFDAAGDGEKEELLRSAGVSEKALDAVCGADKKEEYKIRFYFLELLTELVSSERSDEN